jgi:hypothetical protein
MWGGGFALGFGAPPMTGMDILIRVAVTALIIFGPIWLIARLIDRIKPKKPDWWEDNSV